MPRKPTPRPIPRALVRDLAAAVYLQRQVTAHLPKGIKTREAAARRALRELETDARLFIADRTARAGALRGLAQFRRGMGHAILERHRQYDNPSHRPITRAFRNAVRAAAKHHDVDIPTAALIIATQIAPHLPDAQRADLLGPWRSQEQQVKHLTDRLRRAR